MLQENVVHINIMGMQSIFHVVHWVISKIKKLSKFFMSSMTHERKLGVRINRKFDFYGYAKILGV